jgi:hypothetical protein
VSDAPVLRICARCHVAKPLSEFGLKDPGKGWRSSYCRPCTRERSRAHYRDNVASYVARSRIRATFDRRRNREWVAEYFATHPCVDCGEADPVVLEFDHRELRDKRDNVSRLIHTSTLSAVQAEIAKCDVRCGNCHRIRTAKQFGWYRLGEAELAYLV